MSTDNTKTNIFLAIAIPLIIILLLWFFWSFYNYHEDFVSITAQSYPLGCAANHQKFILRRAVNIKYNDNILLNGTFYYLEPKGSHNEHNSYSNLSMLKVANFNNLNLTTFENQKICIEGNYAWGQPTFFVDDTLLPTEIKNENTILVNIEEIKLVN